MCRDSLTLRCACEQNPGRGMYPEIKIQDFLMVGCRLLANLSLTWFSGALHAVTLTYIGNSNQQGRFLDE